jgi:flagellar hook-associated protein 3 FlgL
MIGRITQQMSQNLVVNDINQALGRLATTQQQLSSGKKINQPSDDPYGTNLALQLNGQLAQLDNYSSNISDGTAWAQTATSALSSMSSMVQRIRELTVQAANGTNSTAQTQAAGAEVNQLISAIKQAANTQYNGQYIFSGTSIQTSPYQTGSTDTYQGGAGAINRTIGPGATIQINSDLSAVLGSGQTTPGQPAGDGKLLNALRNIAEDMQAGNTSSLSADLTGLDSNFSRLTQTEASVGAITDQLNMASSRISALQASETQVLSNTQDADIATTETNFSTQQAALQAALQAGASIVHQSLMNFLSSSG